MSETTATAESHAHIRSEHKRIGERRLEHHFQYPPELAHHSIGLALSGGGIRSATFSLGAMQALSLADAPLTQAQTPQENAAPPTSTPNPEQSGTKTQPSWLHLFDYLSTVSGGGYIGSFFISLFVPHRYPHEPAPPAPQPTSKAAPQSASKADLEAARKAASKAASNAYAALRYAPPGRMRSKGDYSTIGSGPVAWLRDNGRYLTPSGGGDMLYAIALAIRNWFAVHFVIGSLAVAAFGLLAVVRHWIASGIKEYAALEETLLARALDSQGLHIWWSTTWIVPLFILGLWLIPAGAAYWLTYPRPTESNESKARVFSGAATLDLGTSIVLGVIWYLWRGTLNVDGRVFGHLVIAVAGITFVTYLFYVVPVLISRVSITQHRVVLTRAMATGLMAFVAFFALATINTLAQTAYLLPQEDKTGWSISSATIIAVLAWLFRRIAASSDQRALPGWIARLPIGLLAGIAASVLLLLILTVWAVFVLWIEWQGFKVSPENLAEHGRFVQVAVTMVVFLLIAIVNGHFSGFVNLSTLQSLYGARLTRAYLGASNGRRFELKAMKKKTFSVAEPMKHDGVDLKTYYTNRLAPIHIINVTVNQTVDRSEQLTQRDRKGKPMAVLPEGFTVDGDYYPFQKPQNARGSMMQRFRNELADKLKTSELSIGQWIGVSGAAFTTGLGRTTSLGISLALGLANVRLGMWWPSGYGEDESGWLEHAFKKVFKTHVYLYYEMTARFFGMHREWQYLSDGGHFENTALYELLRPERKCRLIVVCDNGADPNYEFGDLAGLIRLVRIDYRLNIELDEQVIADAQLGRYFGRPTDFQRKLTDKEANDKCALMFDVRRCEPGHHELLCKIIVLKPCMITSAPLDVLEYSRTHPAFPDEPTADQFFDEAQWESYRQLGFTLARRIFGRAEGCVGDELWWYVAGCMQR